MGEGRERMIDSENDCTVNVMAYRLWVIHVATRYCGYACLAGEAKNMRS